MAFYSYPFESKNTGTPTDPIYDRAITAEDERHFNKLRYKNGIFIESTSNNDLQVVPGNGMSVVVKPGGCHIEGALGYNDNDITLTLEPSNSSLPRIDRVVLRFNTSVDVRSIMAYVKTGTMSQNPQPPELTQQDNLYELGLADITIPKGATYISATNIRDTRMIDNICPQVVPAIPYVTQLGELYDNYQQLIESALDETTAGKLAQRLDVIEDAITTTEIDSMF
nr:MAG TPA: Receptor Binding Protein [Caudoviricetes sp.]